MAQARWVSTLLGAARYEFRMQVRRKALWAVMGALSLLVIAFLREQWLRAPAHVSAHDAVLIWTLLAQFLLPIGFGVLLADRLPRDRRTHVAELFETAPAGPGPRILGKYLGSALATATPILLVYAGGLIFLLVQLRDLSVLPLGFVAFAAVVVPGLAFVGAFSIACPAVMPVTLYQFLFVGYWFWGNALAPDAGIPTLSETVLTPIGLFRAIGFFGPAAFYGPHSPEYSLGAAIASTVLMFGVAALPLLGLWQLERWRQGQA